MIGFDNRKGQDPQKPFPGFFGKMIDIFDLSSGLPRTKLLTDKPHRDGSPNSRNRPNMVKKKPLETIRVEDNSVSNDYNKSSSKTSSGTPMKMLIAQELSNDVESKKNPSNVVARLMGLDALPLQKQNLTPKGSLQENFSGKEFKDVYEVQHPITEKRMILVREKFTEAKHLATDERLESKEIQDALEVLSSNGDLFLKFLKEPNSVFSKYFQGIQSALPAQTKRITVLKPSKSFEGMKDEAQVKKPLYPSSVNIDRNSTSKSTRIVVLKPNLPMNDDMITRKEEEDVDFNEDIESREVAKEITREMQEYLSIHSRDETLSNGYVGDASSFNNEEECCNASDLEDLTPTSRRSWDYSHRFSSPCSNSSFGQASCSHEPSVIKEAKKRLSERLALVASNEIYKEETQMRRSSSTLGEMLSIYSVNKEEEVDKPNTSSRRSFGREQEIKRSTENAPNNLLRSKSLPASSSVYENLVSELTSSVPATKNIVPKEVAKSFKEKVSSFFSRSKKPSRENHVPSSVCSDDRLRASISEASCKRSFSESILNDNFETNMSANSEKIEGEKYAAHSIKASLFSENLDLPSPISVLEPSFEDDGSNISRSSTSAAISGHPQALSRSPPIGSISRTLTWDSPHIGRSLTSLTKLNIMSKESEEQERFALVHSLLSSANLDDIGGSKILSRWHSLDSPLNPMLLDEFLDKKVEEAKCREKRSNQRLLFDCVNTVLLKIGHLSLQRSYHREVPLVSEEVWRMVNELFSSEEKIVAKECDNQDLVVEQMVKQEVAGSGWVEAMSTEIDEFSREIGIVVLEELVEEALEDLSECVCD